MTRPKILILAFFFPPDAVSGAARPYRFYKYLCEYGFEPWVITASKHAGQLDRVLHAPAPTSKPDRRTLIGAMEKALRVFLFPGDIAVTWPLWAFKVANELLRVHRFDAVISTFPPVNTHLTAYALRRKYGIPWVADFRDPIVDNPFRSLTMPGIMVDRMLEKAIVRNSDAVLTVTDILQQDWIARYPQHARKFHLIWNGYDPGEGISAAPIPPRGHRVLIHVGNLYGSRDPSPILASLRRLLDAGRVRPGTVKLRLVGHLDKLILHAHSELFDSLARHGALETPGAVPRSEALRELATADYLLLLDNSERPGYSVPAKLFEYLPIGRPVLTVTDRDSPVDRILRRSGISHVTIYTGAADQETDAAIESFLRLPTSPEETSDWFQRQFDGRRQVSILAGILRSVLK